jgi:hypothetical protein
MSNAIDPTALADALDEVRSASARVYTATAGTSPALGRQAFRRAKAAAEGFFETACALALDGQVAGFDELVLAGRELGLLAARLRALAADCPASTLSAEAIACAAEVAGFCATEAGAELRRQVRLAVPWTRRRGK